MSCTIRVCENYLRSALLATMILTAGCAGEDAAPKDSPPVAGEDREASTASETVEPPTPPEPSETRNDGANSEIPLFAANSPFDVDPEDPIIREEKQLWARSLRWSKAPELVVQRWLTEEPEMEGKYVLIEFWATWCGPCRESIPLLNQFHHDYRDQLVVVGISDESADDVLSMKDPKIEYFSAIDTEARMKKELGVVGIPHAIVLDPDGYVIWEGFPLLKRHELTNEIIEKILAVGKKLENQSSVE